MSDVALRCPHCGTTQTHPGECDACGEAQVKHWCPNHPGGKWLDGPVCAECEAREHREREERTRRPPPSPPPRPTPRPMPTPRPAARRPTPEVAPPPFDPPPRPAPRFPEELEAPASPEIVVFPRLPFPIGRGARRAAGAGFGLLRGCLTLAFSLTVIAALFVATCLGGSYFSSSGDGGASGGGGIGGWVTDLGQRTGLDVGGTPAQVERGIAAYRAGDRETARRELTEASQLYRRLAVPLLYRAAMRRDEGDPEGAGELLREAVRRQPELAVAHRELGGHYMERGLAQERQGTTAGLPEADFAQARMELDAALRIDPSDRLAAGRMACTLTRLGRPMEARPFAERAGIAAGSDPCRTAPPAAPPR